MNNELYHWKYIKREKVGGKWVYTYDKGAAAKKNYQQAKNNLNTRNAQERSARRHNLPSDGVKNVAFNNYTHYKYGDKGVRDKLEKRYKDAKTEYSKSPTAKKEQRAESLKRGAEKVKNWAKDVAGYDEKHAMNVANTTALIKERKAADTYVKNSIWKIKNPGNVRIAELADWQTNYRKELANEASQKYRDAIKAYEKTPLAKIEKMEDKISSAREYVSDILEGRKADWKAAEKRGTDKAIKEATKYDGGIEISTNGSKKIGKTTFTDVDDWLSGTTTVDTGDTRVSQVRRGKLERYADTAKEYVADRKKRKK